MIFTFEVRVRRLGGLGVFVPAAPKKRGENSTKKSAHNTVCGLMCWFIIWARLRSRRKEWRRGCKNFGINCNFCIVLGLKFFSGNGVGIVSDRRRFSWKRDYGWIAG